jgi:protein-disulfide isomerase
VPKIIHAKLVLVALVLAGGGCRAHKKPREPVAQVAGETVYLDEVENVVAAELFELRNGVLQKLIADKLLESEARKRGVDLPGLWRQEVDDKVPLPDAETAQKNLDTWVSTRKVTAAEASQLSPDQLRERVHSFRQREREQAVFDELYEKGAVQVDHTALGRPALRIAGDGPAMGPTDARITVVEFADLTQSFTAMWQPTLERLLDKYGRKVRFVFKQKASSPESPGAAVAEASLCANDQQRYWEFRKALFHDGRRVGPEVVAAAAKTAALDMRRFDECVASGRNKQNVARNAREAVANKLEGEPVLSVNGIRLSGAHTFTTVDRLLRNEMNRL